MQFVNMKWKRPFDIEQVKDALITLAEVRPRGNVVIEIRGRPNKEVQYLIGAGGRFIPKIEQAFKAEAEVQFRPISGSSKISRPVPMSARMLKLTRASLALNTDIALGMLRAGLATLGSLKDDQTAVIQIILGAAYPPTFAPTDQLDPNASWLDIILGNVKRASSEQNKAMREKANQYSYDAVIRIGAAGKYRESILNSLAGVFRTMSSAGSRVTLKDIDPADMIFCKTPWKMPLRLSINEVAMAMLLPTGEDEYPGTKGLHPLELSLPEWYREPVKDKRCFAVADTSEGEVGLSISPKDALEHTVILGPTGAGKSTTMLSLIMADINAGRSVMVIDPKADLINDILSRMPEKRLKDLVVIDPSSETAVGWNPLEMSSNAKHPELVADAILAVLKDIFSENWGIRAQDVLSAALLTLAKQKDATLLWLPSLLTDETFRKRITNKPLDRISLKPFWEQYDAMKDSERRTLIESSLNKVRQIIFRPGLRNILGSAHPKFKLSELFTKKKIVLVPLNKGLIGSDSARLLGSLLVGLTWIEVLGRADIPKDKRAIVSMYIDELQDYISLPGSFADSLAQARGLGLAITVAHQYRAQLDNNLKEGIDANCRNKIIFGLSGTDAQSIAHLTADLNPIDFMSLPRYHIYTNFMVNGKSTDWISAETIKPEEPIRIPAEAKAESERAYGRPSEEVEAEILSSLYPKEEKEVDDLDSSNGVNDLNEEEPAEQIVIGRKPEKRGKNDE